MADRSLISTSSSEEVVHPTSGRGKGSCKHLCVYLFVVLHKCVWVCMRENNVIGIAGSIMSMYTDSVMSQKRNELTYYT